jgi:hypothetical protein
LGWDEMPAAVRRAQLVERTLIIRDRIAQIFLDADHWNRSVRKSDEALIDCDPDGRLMFHLVIFSHLVEREGRGRP